MRLLAGLDLRSSYNIKMLKVAIMMGLLSLQLTFSDILFAQNAAGKAFHADGVDDFAHPLSPNAAGLSEGTVEFWFSADTWTGSVQMWGGGNGLPGVNGDWTRFGTHSSVGNTSLAFGIYSGDWRWASTGITPVPETWYHVAATWGPSGMRIYLNGESAGQDGHTGGLQDYATELVSASAWGVAYNGNIDELRIWNIARNSSAIASTLNDTLGPEYYSTSDSGLIVYYRMDVFEDLGINSDGEDDLRDFSVHANHLDTQGNPVLNSSGAFTTTDVQNISNYIDGNFSLNQNYPNPFNPKTVISWRLAVGSHVELSVYNVLGKQVATLVSEKMNSGKHSYTFDAKNLASGVYYYQLLAEDFREVKKMLLIK